MRYRFRTADHPQANGRVPQAGETQVTIDIPLDDQARLTLSMGEVGLNNLLSILRQAESQRPKKGQAAG